MSVQSEMSALNEWARGQGRSLLRDDVLSWARENQSSDMWKAFDERGLWDDASAAEVARLAFAGQLLVRCRGIFKERPERKGRSFAHIVDKDSGMAVPGYLATDDVLDDADKRESLIRTVLARIRPHILNYPMEELDWVLYACDLVLAQLDGNPAPRPPESLAPVGWYDATPKGKRGRKGRDDQPGVGA